MAPRQAASAESRASSCANPRIATVLAAWHAGALRSNDRLAFVYGRALAAVLAAPAEIRSGAELQRLRGIGPGLRLRIERQLASDGHPLEGSAVGDSSIAGQPSAVPRPRSGTRTYVPAFRSAAYAVLVALAMHEDSGGDALGADALAAAAQAYASAPLDEAAAPGVRTTPLRGALQTLLKRGLVSRAASRAAYALTDAGEAAALRLCRTGENIVLRGRSERQADAAPFSTAVRVFPHGTYDVVLLVDTREVKSRHERDAIADRLGPGAETRALDLGDFVWVARCRASGLEAVLPCVVERKRLDDLAASVRDGRLAEQSHRLRRSGVSRCVLLVESSCQADAVLDAARLEALLLRTQVCDGIFLRQSASLRDSLSFVAGMTRRLAAQHADIVVLDHAGSFDRRAYADALGGHPGALQTYGAYAQRSAKALQRSLRDVHVRMLAAVRGLGLRRALAVADAAPSVAALREVLLQRGEDDAIKWLGRMVDASGKRVGSAAARRLFLVLCASDYPPEY